MNSFTHLKYDRDICVVTMVTILEQKQYIWKQRKLFYVEMLLLLKKYSKYKQYGLPDALSKEFLFKCWSISHELRAVYYLYCWANYVVMATDPAI